MSMFSKTSATFLSLAAVLVVAGSLSAFAQTADDDRLDEAWKDAIGDQEPVLTEQQFAKLNNLAFQAAVTKICDNYALDTEKFTQGVAEATVPANASMTPEQQEHFKTAVLIRFGTTYGLFLAEGNAKPASFCASAKELKDAKDVPNYWQ
jgi:hypothetical protein